MILARGAVSAIAFTYLKRPPSPCGARSGAGRRAPIGVCGCGSTSRSPKVGQVGTSSASQSKSQTGKFESIPPSTITCSRFVFPFVIETGSKKIDLGRAASTKKDEDRYVFRVPMLRNVARTAPYFHDGSVERLDAAVKIMASVQLGRQLDDAAVADIVAFLDSLTGKVPENYAPPGQRAELR